MIKSIMKMFNLSYLVKTWLFVVVGTRQRNTGTLYAFITTTYCSEYIITLNSHDFKVTVIKRSLY